MVLLMKLPPSFEKTMLFYSTFKHLELDINPTSQKKKKIEKSKRKKGFPDRHKRERMELIPARSARISHSWPEREREVIKQRKSIEDSVCLKFGRFSNEDVLVSDNKLHAQWMVALLSFPFIHSILRCLSFQVRINFLWGPTWLLFSTKVQRDYT